MKLGLATIILVLLEASALAGPSAEDLYTEGQRAYDSAAYGTAVAKWTQSYEQSKAPGLLFNIAQAYRLAGDCSRALSTYKRFIETDPESDQRALADDFIRELEPKCGAATERAKIEPPKVEAEPSSRTPGRALKIAGLATGGGGVALVATGLLFGYRATALGDEVSRACSQTCDWADQKGKDERGRRYATTGYVLDAVGIAAIAAGAITYYLGDRKDGGVVVPQRHEGGVVLTWRAQW